MAEATLAGFRSRFPAFSSTADPDVMNALDEAMIIHNVLALATLYLVAHFLTIDAQVKAGTASRGELSSAGAGPLRAEYVTQAESKGRGAGVARCRLYPHGIRAPLPEPGEADPPERDRRPGGGMTKVPGAAAKWLRVTPTCRLRPPLLDGEPDGGFEDAMKQIRKEYEACAEARDPDSGAVFHVVLTVEWPE